MDIIVVLFGLMIFLPPSVTAFNVDLVTARTLRGKKGSMFGYAVDQGPGWFLIGAPNARRGEVEGAVFKCGAMRKRTCKHIEIENEISYDLADEKTSVVTKDDSGSGYTVVTCATFHSSSVVGETVEPVNTCWIAESRNGKCNMMYQSSTSSRKEQNSCQGGFAASLSQNRSRVWIASPNSFYLKALDFKMNVQNHSLDSVIHYVNYYGVSSAVGRFDEDDVDDFAVGIPSGQGNIGMVVMYTKKMNKKTTITGEQINSHFGSVVTVADFNGDGLDDIVIGAPKYRKQSVVIGRVYVYHQSYKGHYFTENSMIALDGESGDSGFGTAISSLGDIDLDGYNDLCVGAPKAGKHNKGAIYIYLGSRTGIISKVSQIVSASAVPLFSFGAAIAGGVDQDGNGYPDFVVGAPRSNRAVFFRTRPVVKVASSVRWGSQTIDIETTNCDFENGDKATCVSIFSCVMYEGVGVPTSLSFDLELNLDVKDNSSSGKLEQRAFFIFNQTSFSANSTLRVYKGETECLTLFAYIKNDIVDIFTPVKTTLDVSLNPKTDGKKRRGTKKIKPILDQRTTTHASYTVTFVNTCGMDNVCIPDLAVNHSRVNENHILSRDGFVHVVVTVSNRREHAINTKLFVEFSPGVYYVDYNMAVHENMKDFTCSECQNGINDTCVMCDMGYTFKEGLEIKFEMIFGVDQSIESIFDGLEFRLVVNSSNLENPQDLMNNLDVFTIPVHHYEFVVERNDTNDADQTNTNRSITVDDEIDLSRFRTQKESTNDKGNNQIISMPPTRSNDVVIKLLGTSTPEVLYSGNQTGDGRGRLVTHVFTLENKGIQVNETNIDIQWPSHDNQGQLALILDGAPKVVGDGYCETVLFTPTDTSPTLWASTDDVSIGHVQTSDHRDEESEGAIRPDVIKCSPLRCMRIQCFIPSLKPNASFSVTVNSRLKVQRFLQYQSRNQMTAEMNIQSYKFMSMAHAVVIPKQSNRDKYDVEVNKPQARIEVTTEMEITSGSQTRNRFEYWRITLGLLLSWFWLSM